MKKIFIFLGFIGVTQVLKAQAVVTYYDGTPALEKKYTDVEGTELLYPDWIQGQVKTKDGKIFSGQRLKYNQLEDRFYFLSNTGVTMMFVTPVREVALGDSLSSNRRVFRNGFPAVSRFTPETYFEVLVDGKSTLLKKNSKNLVETKDYNSPVTKKQIVNNEQYYLYNGTKVMLMKKDKTAILEAFPEKAIGIEAYLSSKKPNLKKEDELVKMIEYINTL
jgi:hypothetical protein